MKKFELQLVDGVEGNSLYLNEHRIAGPKPWGGGNVIKKWVVEADDIERALRLPEGTIESNAKSWMEEDIAKEV